MPDGWCVNSTEIERAFKWAQYEHEQSAKSLGAPLGKLVSFRPTTEMNMKESIKTTVVEDSGNSEMELEVVFDDDTLAFVDAVTGKEIFSGDWSSNFAKVFSRALDIWPITEEN